MNNYVYFAIARFLKNRYNSVPELPKAYWPRNPRIAGQDSNSTEYGDDGLADEERKFRGRKSNASRTATAMESVPRRSIQFAVPRDFASAATSIWSSWLFLQYTLLDTIRPGEIIPQERDEKGSTHPLLRYQQDRLRRAIHSKKFAISI